jgi:uncharacterized protein YjiS (DUF1127 family)
MRTRLNLRIARAATALIWRLMRILDVRRQRRALLTLDDHMLKDIGVTRFDAWHEGNRGLFDLPREKGSHNRRFSNRVFSAELRAAVRSLR